MSFMTSVPANRKESSRCQEERQEGREADKPAARPQEASARRYGADARIPAVGEKR